MTGLLMVRDESDTRMGNMLDTISQLAQTRGFDAIVTGTDDSGITQSVTINSDYSNPANIFTFLYPNAATVIEKGKQFAKAEYDEQVNTMSRKIAEEIEEGEYEDVDDVVKAIEDDVSVYSNVDALYILNSSDSLEYITGNPKVGEKITDIAWRAMVRDITESLGDIQELLDDSCSISDYDRDEIFGLMADALSDAVRNNGTLVDDVVEEYTNKDKKQEKLAEYIGENASRILRAAADRW